MDMFFYVVNKILSFGFLAVAVIGSFFGLEQENQTALITLAILSHLWAVEQKPN